MFTEIDVNRAFDVERFISGEATGHWIHEKTDFFIRWMGCVVAWSFEHAVDGKTEGVQFSTVVQQAVWYEVVAAHVFGHVVPIMLTHSWPAFSRSPCGLFNILFFSWHMETISDCIWTHLNPQSSTGASLLEFLFRTSSAADQTRINEIS